MTINAVSKSSKRRRRSNSNRTPNSHIRSHRPKGVPRRKANGPAADRAARRSASIRCRTTRRRVLPPVRPRRRRHRTQGIPRVRRGAISARQRVRPSSNRSRSIPDSAAVRRAASRRRSSDRPRRRQHRPRRPATPRAARRTAAASPLFPRITAARRPHNSTTAVSMVATTRISRRMTAISGVAAPGTTSSATGVTAGGMRSRELVFLRRPDLSLPDLRPGCRLHSRIRTAGSGLRHRAAGLLLLFLPQHANLLPLCEQLRVALAACTGHSAAIRDRVKGRAPGHRTRSLTNRCVRIGRPISSRSFSTRGAISPIIATASCFSRR